MNKIYDLTSIKIIKAIVHDIPKHKKNDFSIAPVFSQQESKLTESLKLFFKDSIIKALGRDRAFKICYDSESESPVQSNIQNIFSKKSNFVRESINMGQRLFDIQKGYNASGILFIMLCELDNKNACIVMKLERDGGAQLTLNEKTESFDISQVENLMLTEKTKVFKIALLFEKDDFDCDFDGDLMDYQINIKMKKDLTTFFVSDFLGCKPYEDPKVSTQKFYNLTTAFIKAGVIEKVEQAKYIQDLNSYLQKNSHQINPKEFSDDYFSTPDLRDRYKNFMDLKRFPFSTFPKDLTLIDSKIKKIMIAFKNGISIYGNKGVIKENVTLEELEGGEHKATIVSRISKIQ